MTLRMEENVCEGRRVISVAGEVDLYSSPELRAAVTEAIPKANRAVEIDLAGVAYMDSSGVATLVEGFREAGKRDIDFVLVAPSRAVMKVLQLSRLDSVFKIRAADGASEV